MYKKVLAILLFSFLIIGAANAADFKLNDGFEEITEYFSVNNETGMTICTWEYDDEMVQDYYFQNDTDYRIVEGDNNTFNTTEDTTSQMGDVISYLTTSNIGLDHGVLEVVELDGQKYVIYAFMESGTEDDWKLCYDELMKFNENNNLEPIADAI